MRRILTFALLGSLTSCDKDDLPGGKPDEDPAVRIASPGENESIFSSSVWVDVRVAHFTLAPESIGSDAAPGEGHYHVYVDGAAHGEGAVDRYLVTDLAPGSHEITVRLFDNEHQPVPDVLPAVVNVTIPEDAPRVSIVTPAAGSQVPSSSVELTVTFENHPSEIWYAYVDSFEGVPSGIGDNPTNVVTRIPPGPHTVYVRLHHSDGSPYEPEVVDALQVEIPVEAPRVVIESPGDGSTTTEYPVIRVISENFEIDGNSAGGLPEEGEGHYHIYVDGYTSSHMWQEGFWNETTLQNVPSGERDIYVRLMNNDHTPIEPKIVDRIRVTVQ